MVVINFLKKSCRRLNALGRCRAGCGAALLVAIVWLIPGCPTPPGVQELKKEVGTLKAEVAGLKEKIIQLEAGQKVLLELVKKTPSSTGPALSAPGAAEGQPAVQTPAAPAAGEPLTVEELFKNKDQYLGTRVTVKGVPGPVLMHKKTLFLSSPQGMVEVLYGNLQDKKQVERLTAQNIEVPLTVSGLLSAAPGQAKGQGRLIIMADTVEF